MPRSRCSGPSSKIPYASSRACSARLQLPASAALASRLSEAAITSKSAPSAASFHASGKSPSISSSERSAFAETRSAGATARPEALASRSRPRDSRFAVSSRVAAASRREQGGRDVGERGRGGVSERDRLLDLEGNGDAAPLDAAVVLDRHEPQEAVELARPARLLVGRQRRGPKALELRLRLLRRPLHRRGASARGGLLEAREGGIQAVERNGAPLRAVARRDDRRIPACERGPLGEPGVVAAAGRRDRAVDGGPELRLVRVEQICANGSCGRARGGLAAGERHDRERRVGPGPREPGRRAVLADE